MPSKRSKKNEQVRGKHARHAAQPALQSQPARKPAQPKPAQPSMQSEPARSQSASTPHVQTPHLSHNVSQSNLNSQQPTKQTPNASTPGNAPSVKQAASTQQSSVEQVESAEFAAASSKVEPGYPERAKTPSIPPAQGKSSKRSKRKNAKKKKQRRVPLTVKIALLVILVAALAVGAFLVWNHLFRYDDEQDIQGQWKIEGSNNSIVITEDEIRLTDSVSFEYELNTFEKTITYHFVNYTGEGRYVFSSERDVLTLTDISPEPDEGDTQQSMSLLKVSNQAIGEPESANNNDTADANSTGAAVVDGSLSAEQAEKDDNATSN